MAKKYLFIFSSPYCVPKCLVWIRPLCVFLRLGVNFTNIFCTRFSYKHLFLVTFKLEKDVCTKNARKKRWWNWRQATKLNKFRDTLVEKHWCQFHQRKMRAFLVQTSFWQLFSSYMCVVKAAETSVCTKNLYV